MAAIARAFERAFSETSVDSQILKQLVIFACAGLVVSLLAMTYGVDLSAGFF
jgi:hypothetical protein